MGFNIFKSNLIPLSPTRHGEISSPLREMVGEKKPQSSFTKLADANVRLEGFNAGDQSINEINVIWPNQTAEASY